MFKVKPTERVTPLFRLTFCRYAKLWRGTCAKRTYFAFAERTPSACRSHNLSAVRRGEAHFIFPPAPSPRERSESTRTEDPSAARTAARERRVRRSFRRRQAAKHDFFA